MGYYYYPDDIRIGANWWAAALLATAHLHVGRLMTINGAVGYGPFGYFNVNYQDDAGCVRSCLRGSKRLSQAGVGNRLVRGTFFRVPSLGLR